MNAERIDAYLSSLPFTYRTLSKQGKIRYWLAKQSEGGHMFALLETVPQMSGGQMRPLLLSFGAGDAFSALLEEPHFMPAPYLARAGWIALPLNAAFPFQRVQALLEISYNLTRAKLSGKSQKPNPGTLPWCTSENMSLFFGCSGAFLFLKPDTREYRDEARV